ncbi:MAG: 50S ribosomal protein L35 [Spirochaetes bacterium GWF1_49_6]|jgi:large subunit ribosomal protein L35|nr:MAG: 50S ribosomal protein L35 [Spirochaetes bacterium GWF1_49_6]
MPKLKTNRSAAKRFYVSGSGKLMRRMAGKSHLLSHKSKRRKRVLSMDTEIFKGDQARIKHLIPYL